MILNSFKAQLCIQQEEKEALSRTAWQSTVETFQGPLSALTGLCECRVDFPEVSIPLALHPSLGTTHHVLLS